MLASWTVGGGRGEKESIKENKGALGADDERSKTTDWTLFSIAYEKKKSEIN